MGGTDLTALRAHSSPFDNFPSSLTLIRIVGKFNVVVLKAARVHAGEMLGLLSNVDKRHRSSS